MYIENVQELKFGEKKCPCCAEVIRAEAIKCRYCKSDLPPDEVAKDSKMPGGATAASRHPHSACGFLLAFRVFSPRNVEGTFVSEYRTLLLNHDKSASLRSGSGSYYQGTHEVKNGKVIFNILRMEGGALSEPTLLGSGVPRTYKIDGDNLVDDYGHVYVRE